MRSSIRRENSRCANNIFYVTADHNDNFSKFNFFLVLSAHFAARHYASAVFAIVVCLSVRQSVCRSVTSRYCIETTGRIWARVWHGDFLSHIPLSPKIRALPSGTLSQTLDLENFATASRSRCQRNSSSSTVEFVDDTYTTIDKESWLSTTSRSTSCNPLTPILRFAVYSLYNLFLQLTRCGTDNARLQTFLSPHVTKIHPSLFDFLRSPTDRQTDKNAAIMLPTLPQPGGENVNESGNSVSPTCEVAIVELSSTTHIW